MASFNLPKLKQTEQQIRRDTNSPRPYFDAASAAQIAGDTEKATRYLRMAFNTYDTELLNQYDLKSQGDLHNA